MFNQNLFMNNKFGSTVAVCTQNLLCLNGCKSQMLWNMSLNLKPGCSWKQLLLETIAGNMDRLICVGTAGGNFAAGSLLSSLSSHSVYIFWPIFLCWSINLHQVYCVAICWNTYNKRNISAEIMEDFHSGKLLKDGPSIYANKAELH